MAREIRFFRTDRLSSAAGFFDAAPIPASLTERTVPDPSKRDEAEADAAESTPETSASETTAPTAEPESSDAEPVAANAGEASSSEPSTEEASPESSDDDAPEASSEAESDGEEAATDETVEDDLPEWEPLTPELVEDEAIRGDFMLRWAVVLLALLLGCREIADSASLVRIKTGEYLASNGVLTAGERRVLIHGNRTAVDQHGVAVRPDRRWPLRRRRCSRRLTADGGHRGGDTVLRRAYSTTGTAHLVDGIRGRSGFDHSADRVHSAAGNRDAAGDSLDIARSDGLVADRSES